MPKNIYYLQAHLISIEQPVLDLHPRQQFILFRLHIEATSNRNILAPTPRTYDLPWPRSSFYNHLHALLNRGMIRRENVT